MNPRPVCPLPLPRGFYQRPTLLVARDLLGMHLCHHLSDGTTRSGRIVEVEAYGGPEDRASHARLRKGTCEPTPRSALMFGVPGVTYVYLIYGLHHCVNAVAHEVGAVGAVLVRALEPSLALAGRNCRGPARLCAALGIDRRHNGADLCQPPEPGVQTGPMGGAADLRGWLTVEDRGTLVNAADVVRGPRIGVDYAGEDAMLPFRLCDRRSIQLSRKL